MKMGSAFGGLVIMGLSACSQQDNNNSKNANTIHDSDKTVLHYSLKKPVQVINATADSEELELAIKKTSCVGVVYENQDSVMDIFKKDLFDYECVEVYGKDTTSMKWLDIRFLHNENMLFSIGVGCPGGCTGELSGIAVKIGNNKWQLRNKEDDDSGGFHYVTNLIFELIKLPKDSIKVTEDGIGISPYHGAGCDFDGVYTKEKRD